jgi:hypothetical protein
VSELRDSVIRSLKEFSWGNYGLDIVEIGIVDYPEYQEWIGDLASKIDKDYGDYVDGLT